MSRGGIIVHGQWTYATIDDGQIKFSSSNYVVACTLQQFISLKKYYGPHRVEGIYLDVSDKELWRRACQRNTDKLETIRRFIADKIDFRKSKMREAGNYEIVKNNDGYFLVAVMDCASYIRD